ncbi:fla cluster protein flaF [Halalkalicoccus jeotgali]|uniref:Fla cluster protein flaF n=1 Tax=Halalkalicoccus jeotgali (strain DSM 18796 / CECT 7217 / JCM 14584 / KCTC 4019 / B3) TaxID=795797 RepID=D8J2R4_HALJB|nr:fla cluster protein flaF [Halalkalicoccus jeotgali]ADJ15021.1 fla cluster protein flaF [Halalkalicoccus jeotgali B3]ELY34963.1 fla cluster protein flaF [Halalkalicoccus jeotgali B3]
MGFSVSGSTVVILIGCLIAFSVIFTVATDSFDRVTTAQDEHADRLLDRQNTAIEIGDATRNGTALSVSVTNTGSTALSIDRTDLLVDGEYVTTDPAVIDASGNVTAETNLWVPGETLAYELESNATSVKVVTEGGVAATATVDDSGGA